MPANSELGPAAVVPAVGAPSSTSVLRSLGQRGVRTIAVSDHERPPAFASRFCDERVRVPSPDDDLEAYGRRLLEHLEWHGLASVGFIKDETTGEPKLMEINPRFWANLPMDIHAGVDHPYYYWRLATGGDGDVDPPYDVGTTSHLLRGELVHLHSVLFEDYPLVEKPSATATASEIGRSIVDQPKWDLLRADDPMPFVRDGLNTARTTIERLVPG